MKRDRKPEVPHQCGERLISESGQFSQQAQSVGFPSLDLVAQPQEFRILIVGQDLRVTLR